MARGSGGPASRPRQINGDEPRQRRRPAKAGVAEVVVGTISIDGLDGDRLDRLRHMGISVRQASVGELVREDAARVQASVPFRSENVDRDGFSVIVGLLVAFYYDSGRVDPLRALRRSNVDTYLMSSLNLS